MTQATGSSFFTQAMAVATANTSSTALPQLLAFVGNRLGQARANQLIAKVGHLLTVEQQYTLKETYLYGSSRLGVKNQSITLSSRVASVQNGSLTPVGNAMLNTDSVFFGTANALGLPKAIGARVLSRTWGLKQYELSNHLGNVQVTVSDKKIGIVGSNGTDFTAYQADIKSATDYYAYGMEMPGKGYKTEDYRFGFGGHETMNEAYGQNNIVDMGDRWLDVRLGRTHKTDKRSNEYPSFSPYSFAANNPIYYVDRDGERILIHYLDDKGKNQYYVYGSKQTPPNNAFVEATIKALNEIASSPKVSDKFNDLVQTEKVNITIVESANTTTWVGTTSYLDKNGNKVFILNQEQEVEFNPNLGLKETATGIVNAPFINLWHELGHQYNASISVKNLIDRRDRKYYKNRECERWTDEEEEFNIQQNEWPLVEDKGGFKRETHKEGKESGVEQVKTTGPTSVEEKK